MKLQFRDIEPFVKKPNPKAVVILVYGPDEGLVRERIMMLAKTVVADVTDPFNVAEFTGDALDENPARLADEAQSISMLGGRRVVLVRAGSDSISKHVESLLASLTPEGNLVLIEAGNLPPRSSLRALCEAAPNAAAVPCYVDDERDLSKVLAEGLRAGGYTISSEALTFMAANIVGDRGITRSEIDKLITYMGAASKNVTLDDVIACVGHSAALPIDDLIRHIGTGQFAEADRTLNNLVSEDVQPVTIARALQGHFWKLHLTRARIDQGSDVESALARLKPPLFFKQKPAFQAQVTSLSQAQIEQALNIVISAEARCKQTGADPRLILSRAVLGLCQMISRAGARRRA